MLNISEHHHCHKCVKFGHLDDQCPATKVWRPKEQNAVGTSLDDKDSLKVREEVRVQDEMLASVSTRGDNPVLSLELSS